MKALNVILNFLAHLLGGQHIADPHNPALLNGLQQQSTQIASQQAQIEQLENQASVQRGQIAALNGQLIALKQSLVSHQHVEAQAAAELKQAVADAN